METVGVEHRVSGEAHSSTSSLAGIETSSVIGRNLGGVAERPEQALLQRRLRDSRAGVIECALGPNPPM